MIGLAEIVDNIGTNIFIEKSYQANYFPNHGVWVTPSSTVTDSESNLFVATFNVTLKHVLFLAFSSLFNFVICL